MKERTQMPRTTVTRLRAVLLPLSILLVAACGGPTAAAVPTPVAPVASPDLPPSPVVASPDPVGQAPDPAPITSPDPAKPPVTAPVPKPKPVPVPTVWSSANVVLTGPCYGSPTSTVDGSGRFHVAVGCGMNVRYASSKDGRTWTTTQFKHPPHRYEVDPQVAVDGSTLYLAFTRLRPTDGACGDDGLVDVGVYYRTRQLPAGAWSAPVRIGSAGDHLQSFRVDGGVIHETFTTQDGQGPIEYGTLAGGTFRSVRIPGATGTSLRVGDDGRARIAYTTGRTIRYAVVGTDLRLSTRRIFNARQLQVTSPNLVLGSGDRAFVTFAAQMPWGGGCADGGETLPKLGTYFASDDSGTWHVRRLSSLISAAPLVVDASTGRINAVIQGSKGLREFVRDPRGTWTSAGIPRSTFMDGAVVRRNATTGALLLVASRWDARQDRVDIVAMTKS
jgi:hypothetical protein